MKRRNVEIDTTNFVNTHGHHPKGSGSWWFQVYLVGNRVKDVQVSGKYGYALDEAIKVAKALGGYKVVVLP